MFVFRIIWITFLLFMIGCDCKRPARNGATNFHEDDNKPLIVLFHGLGGNVSSFKILQEALEHEFGKGSVVALDYITQEQTVLYTIKEQSNKCFNKLSEEKLDLQNRPTLLIGHSQGGLRAYKMFHAYKDNLNVKGIITLATPWEGAPVLDTIERLNQSDPDTGIKNEALYASYFTPPVVNDMRRLSYSMGQPAEWIEQQLVSKLKNVQVLPVYVGGYDLQPGSVFLQWIQDTLPEEELPILAIGGALSDFKNFIPKDSIYESSYDFKDLNAAWDKIIVGKENIDFLYKHDMIVPLYSQLAWHITDKENFKRKIIEDAMHDQLLNNFPIEPSKSILCHPTMVKEVIQFGKDIFYSDSITSESQVSECN